jgi:hypothetical protein
MHPVSNGMDCKHLCSDVEFMMFQSSDVAVFLALHYITCIILQDSV